MNEPELPILSAQRDLLDLVQETPLELLEAEQKILANRIRLANAQHELLSAELERRQLEGLPAAVVVGLFIHAMAMQPVLVSIERFLRAFPGEAA